MQTCQFDSYWKARPTTLRRCGFCAPTYNRANQQLRDTGQPDIVREIIAQRMLDMAAKGQRDLDRLCAGALRSLPKQ